jgi:shikimate dehydrogenase
MTQPYRFGLVGHNISHSLSPDVFRALFAHQGIEGTFEVIDISPDRYDSCLIELLTWDGFSVTIPYKESFVAHLKQTSPEVRAIGAVNSVKVIDKRFYGYNTDASAFIAPLREHECEAERVLIMGHGGAARAVLWILSKEYPSCEFYICGRDRKKVEMFIQDRSKSSGDRISLKSLTYSDIKSDDVYHLIINCTPLGGMAYADRFPLPENYDFRDCRICYDLNYRPSRTALLHRAQEAGCTVIEGFSMLVRQAVTSYTIWTGKRLDADRVSHEIIGLMKDKNEGVL